MEIPDYTARPRALAPLVDWMSYYGRFWHDRVDRLEDLELIRK